MANSAAIATFHKNDQLTLCKSAIASGLGTIIHRVLYFWGRSIQKMGGTVVIGRSISGVVVIDGSLYP